MLFNAPNFFWNSPSRDFSKMLMINPDRYLKNTGQEGKFSKRVPVKLSLFQQPGYRGMAPTENELPDRRAQAIQGAFDALKSHGLGELSFDLVASKSGMSRQLVRHYFPDHEALMIAVCDHLARLYSEPLIAAASALDGPERISVFLDFYFDLLADNPKPRDDQVYDAMMALAARSAPIRTALADQYGLLGQVLGHEFVVQYPELSQQSASELSFLFVSMMYGHWKMVASLGYSEEHNMVTRRAIDRLIKSYIESPSALSQPIKIWSKQPKL